VLARGALERPGVALPELQPLGDAALVAGWMSCSTCCRRWVRPKRNSSSASTKPWRSTISRMNARASGLFA
jgi:hypothetical protein